jgi:hypothetical protein
MTGKAHGILTAARPRAVNSETGVCEGDWLGTSAARLLKKRGIMGTDVISKKVWAYLSISTRLMGISVIFPNINLAEPVAGN